MTKHAALASDEFIFSFKVLEAGAVDNSRRHRGAEKENRTHLARPRAVIPGRTLQARIIRNGRKIP
jgi:hypothetical protein